MPHKHTRKVFVEDGYYHAYNRGVDKRIIFENDQDYRVFLHLLKYYLSENSDKNTHPLLDKPDISLVRPRPLANLHSEVDLLCYCLMPNHFHLLLHQTTKEGMSKLARRLLTTYAMYFNKRYDRVGHLFQGAYKAAMITEDSYLLHLSRYIHRNPIGLTRSDLVSYPYSSYVYYLKKKKADWVKTELILNLFSTKDKLPTLQIHSNYQDFVETGKINSEDQLGSLTID